MAQFQKYHPVGSYGSSGCTKEEYEDRIISRIRVRLGKECDRGVIRLILEECNWQEIKALNQLLSMMSDTTSALADPIGLDLIACSLLDSPDVTEENIQQDWYPGGMTTHENNTYSSDLSLDWGIYCDNGNDITADSRNLQYFPTIHSSSVQPSINTDDLRAYDYESFLQTVSQPSDNTSTSVKAQSPKSYASVISDTRTQSQEKCASFAFKSKTMKQMSQTGKKVEALSPIPDDKDANIMVLMRGLPGSGKTYLARKIQGKGQVFSTDDFFMHAGIYRFSREELPVAHSWNQKRVQEALEKGVSPVIIDNTNICLWEMIPYGIMACQANYSVKIMEPSTSWKRDVHVLARKSEHCVPMQKIREMKNKFEKFDETFFMAEVQKSMKVKSYHTATRRTSPIGENFRKSTVTSNERKNIQLISCVQVNDKGSFGSSNKNKLPVKNSGGFDFNGYEDNKHGNEGKQQSVLSSFNEKTCNDFEQLVDYSRWHPHFNHVSSTTESMKKFGNDKIYPLSEQKYETGVTRASPSKWCSGSLSWENQQPQRKQHGDRYRKKSSLQGECATDRPVHLSVQVTPISDANEAQTNVAWDNPMPRRLKRLSGSLQHEKMSIQPEKNFFGIDHCVKTAPMNLELVRNRNEEDCASAGVNTSRPSASEYTAVDNLSVFEIDRENTMATSGQNETACEDTYGQQTVSEDMDGEETAVESVCKDSNGEETEVETVHKDSNGEETEVESVFEGEPLDLSGVWDLFKAMFVTEPNESDSCFSESGESGSSDILHENKTSESESLCPSSPNKTVKKEMYKSPEQDVFERIPSKTISPNFQASRNVSNMKGDASEINDSLAEVSGRSGILISVKQNEKNEFLCSKKLAETCKRQDPQKLTDLSLNLLPSWSMNVQECLIQSNKRRLEVLQVVEYENIRCRSSEQISDCISSNAVVGANSKATAAPFDSGLYSEFTETDDYDSVSDSGNEFDEHESVNTNTARLLLHENGLQPHESRTSFGRQREHTADDTWSLKLSGDFVRGLENAFGKLFLPNQGTESEFVTVTLNNTQAKWMHKILSGVPDEDLQTDVDRFRQLQEDEALARRLQQEEEDYSKENLRSDSKQMKESTNKRTTGYDHKKTEPPSLRAIIEEEKVIQRNEDAKKQFHWEVQNDEDLATSVKRKRLYQLFPHVDETFINDFFLSHGMSFEKAKDYIQSIGIQPDELHTIEEPGGEDQDEDFPSLQDHRRDPENKVQLYKEECMKMRFHYKLREECLQKAKEFCSRGMGSVAVHHREEANKHYSLMKSAKRNSAQYLQEVREGRVKKEGCLDLHGFSVSEAVGVLKSVLTQYRKDYLWTRNPNDWFLHIITGHGKNSYKRQPRIKPAVQAYLVKENFKYIEVNPGMLKIKLG